MVLLDYTWTSGWLKRGRIDGVEDIDGVAVAVVDAEDVAVSLAYCGTQTIHEAVVG